MGTARLGSKTFRLDPTRLSWSYDVRTSERDTLGGRVVQIFGAEISDMTVAGTFGAGGWREQATWLNYLVGAAEAQAQGNLPPLRFVYPGLGVDLQCYLKAFAQPEGSSVTASDSIIAPQWVITLVPLEDAGTLRGLKDAAITGYIERLSVGVGWKQTQYNGPLTAADLAAAIGGNNDAAAQVFFAKTAEPVAWAALQAAAALVQASQAPTAVAPTDTSGVPLTPAVIGPGGSGDWGPGWPNCQEGEMAYGNGGGIKIQMHKRLIVLTCALLNKTAAMGYPILQAQTGGFVCRPIAGTQKPSNHSRGTAIDINWRQNGFGASAPYNLPPGVIALWKAYGFEWGGDWRSPKDWMHFEFKGSKADADTQTQRIQAA